MIIGLYPEPKGQARALGAFSFSAAAGGSVGLVVGGLVTQALSWHWVFLVNVPIGIATWLTARRTLDETPRQGIDKGADYIGAVLSISGLMLSVSAIVGAADRGWTSARTLSTAGLAAGLLAGFIWRQNVTAKPLLPMRVFGSRRFAGGNVVLALLISGMFSFQFLTALYLQRVLGYGPSTVGLAIVPVALGIAVMSLFAFPRLIARFGLRPVLLAGLAMLALGLALLARLPVDGTYVTDILPALTLLGIGFGVAMPALTSLTMSEVQEQDAGIASGMFNTTQQVSGALGLAVAASVAAAHTSTAVIPGAGLPEALTRGYTSAFAFAAGLVATAVPAAFVLLRHDRREATADVFTKLP
jgi:MFS family permease